MLCSVYEGDTLLNKKKKKANKIKQQKNPHNQKEIPLDNFTGHLVAQK